MMGEGGPIGALLNGMSFHDAPATEFPALGTTEMWEIVNMTGDTHPIHLHLVQFQLLNRQKINARRYEHAFMEANPVMPAETYVPVPVEPYLKGKPIPADPNERGWKDTFRMNPGEVTRILMRFAPQDDSPAYTFDATSEPGYVWHCHILEHEENDMMRPFHLVGAAGAPGPTAKFEPVPAAHGANLLGAAIPSLTVEGGSLRFSLTNPGRVEIGLYNVAGQRVRHLASGSYAAGQHVVAWQPSADSGEHLAAGVYLVQFRSDQGVQTRKVVLSR
jgi:hypothetical protein